MGVRGLTTFIANRSSQYLQNYELHDSYVVIDGNAIASQLYKWHCKCNDCFGGDYDKYANIIKNFYQLLQDCNITPLVIFDGAYERRKLNTVYTRMRNKICSAKKLNSVTEDSIPMFPLFLRELFTDITLQMNVKCYRCDFEGDGDCAYLARNLNCPVLSYDSDFYIFDVLYIPFSTMELRLRKRHNLKYISCQIYRVENFLNSFGGMDKINLPLLAVLLGNDYIKKNNFNHFYKYLKLQKLKDSNRQQQQIKSLIVFLNNESPDSALRKILGRYKLCYRQRLAKMIKKGIKGYQSSNPQLCEFFGIEVQNAQQDTIIVPNPEEIKDIEEYDAIESEDESSEEEVEGDDEEEVEDMEEEPINKYKMPSYFHKNYQKCLYPSCFMDMVVSHTYYAIPQVEDYTWEHSHTISLDILAAIYKILTFPRLQNCVIAARIGSSNVKKSRLPFYRKPLPKLTEVENLESDTRKKILLDVLNIRNEEIFNQFPNNWHLFLISLKYWVFNSRTRLDMSYIYSIILCGIILNYVDEKIGFYRSTKSFFAKYPINNNTTKTLSDLPKNIRESLQEIDVNDGISCMQKLIHYFQMEAKMKTNIRLFDINIVHQFAEFQSVLLHVKHLNALLNFPFPSLIVSDFLDGTFLYNMTTNLTKRTDLKSYMNILLGNSKKILNSFELMITQLEIEIGSDMVERGVPKKRRKKKKKKKKNEVPEEDPAMMVVDSEEENLVDPNNLFSVLSIVNT